MSKLYIVFRCVGCGQGPDISLDYVPRNEDGTLADELTRECPNCVAMGNVSSIRVNQKFIKTGPAHDAAGVIHDLVVL